MPLTLKNNTIIVLLVFLAFGCADKHKETNTAKNIYALVIDNAVTPFPPPPPPKSDDHFSKQQQEKIFDSINKITLRIAIAPAMKISQSDSAVKHQIKDSVFNKLVNRLFKKDTLHTFPLKTPYSYKGHSLSVVESAVLDNKKQLFEEFDQLIFLSNILFNKKGDHAVVYIGITLPGKLSGATSLYLLKKSKKTWIIEEKLELSIS